MEEAGIPGMAVATWYSILAPAGTPKPIIDKLNAAINKAVSSPDFRKKLEDLGTDPMTETPEYFKKFLDEEIVRWRDIIKQSGATVG
jgi:tripartite-type tricarboxylate transporter receptor subunit TctC